MRSKEFIKPFFSILAIVLIPFFVWRIPAVQYGLSHSQEWCHEPWAWAWFLGLSVPYFAVGLPRQALCVVAGIGFGTVLGFTLCSISYELGVLIAYVVGRILGLTWSTSFLRPVTSFMTFSPFKSVLCLRLLPIGSSLLVSVASGGLRLPVLSYLVATALGGMPQNVIFVLMGSGLHIGHQQELLLAAVLFIASIALGMMMLKRYHAEISLK